MLWLKRNRYNWYEIQRERNVSWMEKRNLFKWIFFLMEDAGKIAIQWMNISKCSLTTVFFDEFYSALILCELIFYNILVIESEGELLYKSFLSHFSSLQIQFSFSIIFPFVLFGGRKTKRKYFHFIFCNLHEEGKQFQF